MTFLVINDFLVKLFIYAKPRIFTQETEHEQAASEHTACDLSHNSLEDA